MQLHAGTTESWLAPPPPPPPPPPKKDMYCWVDKILCCHLLDGKTSSERSSFQLFFFYKIELGIFVVVVVVVVVVLVNARVGRVKTI